jgi:hypothetical protein
MSVTNRTNGGGVAGGASVAPAAGATPQAGDRSILWVGTKPSSATIDTPSGWTLIGQASGGTGSQAADTGPSRIAAFYQDGAIGTGTHTVTITGGNSSLGVINTFQKSLGAWVAVAFTTGDDTTGGDATYSATCAADPGIVAGDALVAYIHIPTDASTVTGGSAIPSAAITVTGLSGGTTASAYNETGTGFDAGGGFLYRTGFTGTSSAAPVVSASFTASVNTYGPCIVVRLRDETPADVRPLQWRGPPRFRPVPGSGSFSR